MLALYGFATIIVFLYTHYYKTFVGDNRVGIGANCFCGIAGFNYQEIGNVALAGIKQVAPTGILLMFAVLYFSVMLGGGLFDPVIAFW